MIRSKFSNTSVDFPVDNDTCFSTRHSNYTGILYEGVPETLILNLVSWVFLLLLFALLRSRAWDYGRLALVQKEKWTQLFYKNSEDTVVAEEGISCCFWFPERCGPDASHYLSFQRHLLVLSAIITAFSVCVILPINFKGNLQGGPNAFGHTTISNLDPKSDGLWVHVIISFCFVLFTILIMPQIPTANRLSSRTVMITNISEDHRNVQNIRNYFSVRYPDVDIQDVQLAYKIKELSRLEHMWECAYEAKTFCIVNNEYDMKIQPYGCVICCPWKTKNAIKYYTAEEERLRSLVIEKRIEALQQPLGIAFVTFGSEEAAQYIVQFTHFDWSISKAPAASDILWKNLQTSRNWYSKTVLINCILFVVLFFLTTPAVVVSLLNILMPSTDDIVKKVSPMLSEFLPTLLLLAVSALMPVIVGYSDRWMSHWTKSEQNFATMQKTFYFLLFMVLILPSFGLVSAQALVEWSLQSNNRTYRWECVFLPDKGAFFVNYVITSALIGTALVLLRFPELAMYVWRLMLAKSSAEKISIQKAILSEFPSSIHYARTLLIFTISTVYSLICPLITPFGLLYLCLKYLVDKHNICFVYKSSGTCGEIQKIHVSAVRNVRVAIILLQITMLAFTILRGELGVMSVVIILGILATCGFFFINPFSSCKPTTLAVDSFPEQDENYIAPVLIKVHSQTITTPNYGSSSSSDFSKSLSPT